MSLHWGIVSTGKISSRFAKTLTILPQDDHKIVAVAARDINRSQEFAKQYSINRAYGSYEGLAKDPDVEVVYVGCIHPYHFEISKMMLEHGKHVLCEKPMTMNEKQTRTLIGIARSAGVFLMEGVWSRCFPIYEQLKTLLNDGVIGTVKHVNVNFGFKMTNIERLAKKELGGGIILDLGIYNLQFQQYVFGVEEPISIKAAGHLNAHGTDDSANAIITYKGGRTAVLSMHASVEMNNEAIVIGDKGFIKVPQFWKPTSLIMSTQSISIDVPPRPDDEVKYSGMVYEAEEVRSCIREGRLESTKITHEESIQLAKFMDEIRRQIGVVYKEDSM